MIKAFYFALHFAMIFLGMIISLVAIAIWSAKETQHFIDSKNAQARLDRAFKIAKEREDKNNG